MFSSAIKYFKEYRKSRARALRNREKMRWFTSESSDLSGLMEDTFGSDSENDEWEGMDAAGNSSYSGMCAVRLRIAFLAGCRHDLRNQFAIGSDHEPKTIIDFDRHAVNETIYSQWRLDLLERVIDTKKASGSGS